LIDFLLGLAEGFYGGSWMVPLLACCWVWWGFMVGIAEGFFEGILDGFFDGLAEGLCDGILLGFTEGLSEPKFYFGHAD